MLAGVRVIDFGSYITAPLAAMMLGDLGADVIKVERPGGDPFRRGHGDDYGPTFCAYNRNKRSIVLDPASEHDREALSALLTTADVLIDNIRLAGLKRLGLDPIKLKSEYPKLIHCSITGFGTSGPYAKRPAFDSVGQALSGIGSLLIDPAVPDSSGPTISDTATGMYAVYAILGALYERERTGFARRIEVNMLEASMAFIQDRFLDFTRAGNVSDRYTRPARSQCFSFRCSDGRLFSIHLSTTEKFWQAFLQALDDTSLAKDSRYATHRTRVAHYHSLSVDLARVISTHPRSFWLERLEQFDVPFASINTVEETMSDPQVAALGTAIVMSHPVKGAITGIACPVLSDGRRPTSHMRPAPMVGEHSEEIMNETRRLAGAGHSK